MHTFKSLQIPTQLWSLTIETSLHKAAKTIHGLQNQLRSSSMKFTRTIMTNWRLKQHYLQKAASILLGGVEGLLACCTKRLSSTRTSPTSQDMSTHSSSVNWMYCSIASSGKREPSPSIGVVSPIAWGFNHAFLLSVSPSTVLMETTGPIWNNILPLSVQVILDADTPNMATLEATTSPHDHQFRLL